MRPRHALLLLLTLAAGTAVLLLLGGGAEEPDTGAWDEAPHEEEATTTAGLTSTGAAPTQAPPAKNPFSDVTDWKVLGRGLWLNAERENAVARAVELLRHKPEEIRKLVRRLHPEAGESEHSGQNIVRGVTQTLLRLGTGNLDLLLEELDDENAVYRTRVVALIGSFGNAAERLVPALIERFRAIDEDPPAGEVASYVNALRFIGPAASAILPDLEGWLEDGATPDVEVAAIRALHRIAGPTDAVFARYREVLTYDGWPAQRRAVLQELCGLGAKAAPMIPLLLDLVDEGVLDEAAALHTIAYFGVATDEVLARAERGLRALPKDWESLGAYGFALARLGEKGMRLLMRYVDERGLAARALLPVTLKSAGFDHGKIFALTRPALASKDAKVRLGAWRNLSTLERLSPATAETELLQGLRDADREVRRVTASIACARAAPTRALRTALLARVENSEEEPELRVEAASMLAEHETRPSERLYTALLAIHRSSPHLGVAWQMSPWLAQHPGTVLRLWIETTKNSSVMRLFWPAMRTLPVAVRRQHADAIRTLGLDPETGKPLKR